MDELAQMARNVIDANQYLVLGTSEDDGRPRVSPVYFNHADYRDFYWVSSPDAQHSHNVAARREVSFVIFNSTLLPTQDNQAVYVDATVEQIQEADLPEQCARAFAHVGPGTRAFAPEELSGDGALRLYRATATRYDVHIRGSHPVHGTGIDRRQTVDPDLAEPDLGAVVADELLDGDAVREVDALQLPHVLVRRARQRRPRTCLPHGHGDPVP